MPVYSAITKEEFTKVATDETLKDLTKGVETGAAVVGMFGPEGQLISTFLSGYAGVLGAIDHFVRIT